MVCPLMKGFKSLIKQMGLSLSKARALGSALDIMISSTASTVGNLKTINSTSSYLRLWRRSESGDQIADAREDQFESALLINI